MPCGVFSRRVGAKHGVPTLITRTTIPYVSTPDLGPGVNRKHGFGDTVALGLFTPKLKAKGIQVGLGYTLTLPTAGDNEFTGSGKWQAGPSFIYINRIFFIKQIYISIKCYD